MTGTTTSSPAFDKKMTAIITQKGIMNHFQFLASFCQEFIPVMMSLTCDMRSSRRCSRTAFRSSLLIRLRICKQPDSVPISIVYVNVIGFVPAVSFGLPAEKYWLPTLFWEEPPAIQIVPCDLQVFPPIPTLLSGGSSACCLSAYYPNDEHAHGKAREDLKTLLRSRRIWRRTGLYRTPRSRRRLEIKQKRRRSTRRWLILTS